MATDIASLQIRVDTSQVKTANKDLDSLSRSSKTAESSSKSLATGFNALRSSLVAVGVGAVTMQLVKSADALTKFTSQLKNATSSQAEFADAFDNVRNIATRAQAPIEAVGSTYARLANSLKDLNVEQSQVASVAETVALGLKVNGASAEETASAMLQLSQSFGSGKMQGDEFRSAMESMPSLMREVAKTMGVNIGALKGLSSEGAITSEVLLKTFTNPELLAKLRTQADSMKTIGGSLQEAKNELLLFSGTIAQKLGIVDAFSFAINAGSNTLKGFNDQLTTGKTRIEGFLPAYEQYRKAMDKEYKPQAKFEFAPRVDSEGGKFNLGEYAVNAPSKQLMNEIAALKEDKPLKDLIAAQQEYKKNLNLINQAEKEGLVTSEEASRYRIQFAKDLAKFSKDAEEAKKKEIEKANELETKRLNVAIWVNEQIFKSEKEKRDEMAEIANRHSEINQRRANENFEEAQRIYKESTDKNKAAFEELKNAVDGYSRDMARSLAEFAINGKMSFGDMIDSMLIKLLQFANQKYIFDPLFKSITGAMESSSGGGGIGGLLGSLGSAFSGLFNGGVSSGAGAYSIDQNPYLNMTANAKGGMFSGAGISAFSGSVVSKPTIFPFAKGIGLMGEAGAEAILPLKRGSDGKLGVTANGGGGGNVVNIQIVEAQGTKANIEQQQNPDGTMSIKVIVEQLYGVMNRDLQRGGGIAPTLERRYGLNRVAGA